MTEESNPSARPTATPEKPDVPPPQAHPLSDGEQTQNILIYGAITGLFYLAAPVLYVGIAQAALLHKLEAGSTLANLPASVYSWVTPVAVLVVWLLPKVRELRLLLVGSQLLEAAMGSVVGLSLLFAPRWTIAAVVLHAGVLGCANGVAQTALWELLGRGISASRRGQALALAFGGGPVLAMVGSLAAQLTIEGEAFGVRIAATSYPWNFAALFFATTPIMLIAAVLAARFIVPLPKRDVARQPFVAGIFGGFGRFFFYPPILITIIAYVLVYSADNAIMPNVILHAETAIGGDSEQYVGYAHFFRFGFKVVAGFALGWLLTRTHPKAGLLVTAGLAIAGVTWALFVPGKAYLVGFGLLGAGELFGVYYYNYILCCSPKSRVRRNMAFMAMMNVPVGVAPVLFGAISEYSGLRSSFCVAIVLAALAMLLAGLLLPRHPQPCPADMDPSDLEAAAAS